jgi:hypothetical protein
LPLLELIPNTQRSSIEYDFAADGSYQWKQILSFLHPYVFGYYRGNEPIDFVNYFATPGKVYHFWETAYFFGIIPLILSLFGIFKFRNNFIVRVLLIASLLFFLHALGSNGFLFKYLFPLPGFSSFRIPSRTLLYLVFSLCILSAFSLDYLMNNKISKRDILLFIGVIITVTLTAIYIATGGTILIELNAMQINKLNTYGLSAIVFACLSSLVLMPQFRKYYWSYILGILLVLISFIDLCRVNKSYKNSDIDISKSMYLDDQLLKAIKSPVDPLFRFASSEGRARILKRNQASYHGIYSMDGFYGFNLKTRSDMPPNWPINDLMSVQITSDIKANDAGEATIGLTQHPQAQNHLRMSYNIVQNTDKKLDGSKLDFKNITIVDKSPGVSLSDKPVSDVPHSVKLEEYNFNSQKIKVITEEPGILVAAEYYYPNWKSYLDGKPVETIKANYLTRGVAIPAGEHEVMFQFESHAYNLGLWISLLSFLGCFFLLFSGHNERLMMRFPRIKT